MPPPPLPPHHRIIKVARDEDFRSRIGNDGRYFDLVDFSTIDVFYVPDSLTIYEFKGTLMEKFETPVQCQRLWWWARRQNKTYRIDRPLTTEEEKLSVSSLRHGGDHLNLFLEVLHPHSQPTEINEDDALVFLKLFDPEKAQLRYVGSLYVKVSSRPSDILPKLRSLAGFCASEPIELYEEVDFDPSVMCEAIDIDLTFSASGIMTGDIICYQKSPPQNWRIYSSVVSFLQHVCDHKEEEWKRHILEEEIVVLKRQADTDRLQKDESMTGISAEHFFFVLI